MGDTSYGLARSAFCCASALKTPGEFSLPTPICRTPATSLVPPPGMPWHSHSPNESTGWTHLQQCQVRSRTGLGRLRAGHMSFKDALIEYVCFQIPSLVCRIDLVAIDSHGLKQVSSGQERRVPSVQCRRWPACRTRVFHHQHAVKHQNHGGRR
jgi:hypothetical protein